MIEADFQLAGGASALFDHVFVQVTEDGARALANEAAAIAWLLDAYQHLKVIGSTEGGRELLQKANLPSDDGILIGREIDVYLKTAAKGKVWQREPSVRTIY
jgi:catalase